MKKIIEKYNIQLKLLLALTLGLICLSTLFYFLIPMILNYPAETYATAFQQELENTNYMRQVLSIAFAIFVIFTFLTFYKTNFLVKYSDLLKHPEAYSIKEINFVKNKLLTVPYSLFVLNITIPSIALTVIHATTVNQFGITTLKLFLLVLSLMVLYVTVVFIYTTKLFKKILITLPYDNISGLKKSTLKKRMFYNIAPLLFASMLFLSLLGYTKVAIETGNSLFETYKESLHYFCTYNTFSTKQDLLNKAQNFRLQNSSDIIFIRDSNENYVDVNGNKIEFSNFFNKYLNELSPKNDGRVYEYYGIDCQGASYNITINGEDYTIGVYFKVISTSVLIYFTIAYFFLLTINIIILILFSRSVSDDINTISESFIEMVKNKDVNLMQPLPLTSTDEIGQLTISFNKIQQLTKSNIEQIHDNQETLIEQERLASLGQLIGGIAHNLKTPIMSISGASEGLLDLINEYSDSIGDPEVTKEDHLEIASDMREWITKIQSHLSYMSDVITTVKGQAVTFSENTSFTDFTVGDLIRHINILMKHELSNALVELEEHVQIEKNTSIKGNINSLVQVINNMISNAIQAYNGKSGEKIILSVYKEENNKLIISIQDFAGGLPETVKTKLFKEMITTKGKAGTGLGLFMSYSNIKAHFNGDITFDTADGQGTIFYIEIPV